MRKMVLTAAGIVSAVLISSGVMAQSMSNPGEAAMEKIMKAMGNQSLSAKVVMTMEQAKASKNQMGPMEFMMYMSKGNVRMEMDMAKMAKSAGGGADGMPPGMDKMVSITRTDKKVIYQIMPSMNAYCEMPIPQGSGTTDDSVKIERKNEGKEKIDKYDCDKVRAIATAKDGTKTEVVMWEAKELGGLPIQTETTIPEGKVRMQFKDIKKDTPAASLFEPPAGATKYNSMQEMMMSVMMKMMPR